MRPGTGAKVSSVVVALGVVSLLTDISSESVSAVLPLYITGVIGLSTIAYGFIDGLYQGVSALVRIAGGWAADRGDQPEVGRVLRLRAFRDRAGSACCSPRALPPSPPCSPLTGSARACAPRRATPSSPPPRYPETSGASFGVHRMLDTIGAALGPLIAFLILLG